MTENIVLGRREQWGEKLPVVLSTPDRRHHLYAIGKSGTGKTTLLRNLVVQDIEDGRGVALIDPHGDLAEEILDYVPSRRVEDVVYFNPSDLEYPIGFNLLGHSTPDERHVIASGIVSVFRSIWPDFWGPRLEYILYAAVAALLECDNVSLLSVQRMLTDVRYRAWVTRQVNDPIVHLFWTTEFESFDRRFVSEAIAPIQNKVGQLLMSPHVRNILGQVRSKIGARFMMDHGRIFIANLSKGRIGADKASLLGALLVTQFQLAAMSRADVPEDDRKDYFLYVDEFQSVATDSFASVLSEARKYRLCLTLTHQYVDQLRTEIRNAIFGNVGSIMAFRVGHKDAELLQSAFGNDQTAAQFTTLNNGEVYAKILADGRDHAPFLGRTLPPHGCRHGLREAIIRRSRERYSTPRHVVQSKIQRWLRTTHSTSISLRRQKSWRSAIKCAPNAAGSTKRPQSN